MPMNKARIETLSDGIFAIVMTLLVFDIHLPTEASIASTGALAHALAPLAPFFLAYALSFFILSVFWINHHFIFHSFAKSVDRWLNLLNMAYLLFLVAIPFSTRLLASFLDIPLAVIWYGCNILIVSLLARVMTLYILATPDIAHDAVSSRLQAQSRFRSSLTVFCYVVGIFASMVSIPLSLALYAIPLIFNFIPGTLDATERFLNIRL